MLTIDEQMDEWLATHERIAKHIDALNAARRIHLVGDISAKTAEASLAKLATWRQEIDALMIDWLMPE